VALALAAVLGLCASTAIGRPLAVGDPAPAFVGSDLDGAPLDLASLRGRVVVVNLWATWCGPCRAEMPMLDQVYRAHRPQGLMLIGLSADRRRDVGAVRKVIATVAYPAAMLSAAKVNGFGEPAILPITYVVDGAGVLRGVFPGAPRPLTREALEAAISAAKP
jgi:thiol-disulfide isomerase/thioredoxin